jgi:hypothetical protein
MDIYKKSFQSTPDSSLIIDTPSEVSKHVLDSGSSYNIYDVRIELSEESKIEKKKRAKSVDNSSMMNSHSIIEGQVQDKHRDYLIINYEKDHQAELPGGKLIKLIKDSYPELMGPDTKLKIGSLVDVIKMGAKVNHLDSLSEDIMNELAHMLDLPLALDDKYIDSISAIVNALSSDHRSRYSNTSTKFKNRRSALVINPQARIMHGDENVTAVGHDASIKHKKQNTKKSKTCLCWLKTRNRYSTINIIFLVISVILFLINAYLAYVQPMYDLFGPSLLISRGAALSILIFTMIAMFFVSYDLTS